VISKSTYHVLLTSNKKISFEQMEGLAELVNDFPYSQNIRQLYLKALYQNESIKFEGELKKTAAYTSNRSHLKSFILNDEFENDNQVIFTALIPQKESVESKIISEKKTTDKSGDAFEDKPVPEIKNSPNPITEDVSKSTGILDPSLNDEFLSEAINASISMEVEKPQHKESTKEAKEQPKPRKEQAEEVAHKRSFIQWIKHYDQEQQTKAVDRAKFKEKAALLIDEFIRNQPKIAPKKDFYSPINMANKSLQETGELASETLAKIHFEQGNHDKAIKMYQSLSLKLPEKKAYFADQIKKIKNFQNK
jgi:hypothetical protein